MQGRRSGAASMDAMDDPMAPLPEFAHKLCPREQLGQRIVKLPRPLVFTNGVFDLLHLGHVTYLARARDLGASLVVGLNTDASVRRLGKGPDRPLHGEQDRALMLAALSSVSLVTWFDEDNPVQLVRELHPDFLVKGGDYEMDPLPETKLVRGYGGCVMTLPLVPGRSTSSLVKLIRDRP